jgi:hypothetical protein
MTRAPVARAPAEGMPCAKAGARYVIHRPSDMATREYRTRFDANLNQIEKARPMMPRRSRWRLHLPPHPRPGEGHHVEVAPRHPTVRSTRLTTPRGLRGT